MAQQRDHDWGFVAFAAVGFLIAFGFVTGFSIGLPILFLGLVLLAMPRLWRYDPPADLGLLAGAGVVCLFVATSGVDGAVVWAAIGATLAVTSTFAFWWLRCRPARPSA
jgi:predicted cobalt transporter CbtA